MLWFGITLGLGAATAQSLSYLFSRWFTARHTGGPVQLWSIAHVIQGVICLPAAFLLWPRELHAWQPVALPLLGTAGFYAIGQVFLFMTLRQTDASRISALLGLKIPMVALLYMIAFTMPVTGVQWLAVALAVGAAFVLNYTGGSLKPATIVLILLTCLGYAGSDACIKLLIASMPEVQPLYAAVFGVCLTYILCAAFSLLLFPWIDVRRLPLWRDAAPYAVTWLASMMFLFACFAIVDIVFGNILQATRGVISVLLGALVSRWGLIHIEQRIARGVFWRRLAAAALMSIAIALFMLGKTGS